MHSTYHVPETMSSEHERSLQHQLNRWCVGARRRSNDVSKGKCYKMIKSHRLNRHHSIGSTDGCQLSCRSVREANGWFQLVRDRMFRCPMVGCSDAYAENWPTASNDSLELVAYIYVFPWPFEACWSPNTSYTHKHPRTPPSHPRA